MTNDTPALQLRALRKSFGRPAVDGIDLTVRRGELYALLGPNGAGKTTTLRMVAGLLAPDAGEVEVLGVDLARDPGAPSSRWPACRTTRCCTGSSSRPSTWSSSPACGASTPRTPSRARAELLEWLDLSEHAHERSKVFRAA